MKSAGYLKKLPDCPSCKAAAVRLDKGEGRFPGATGDVMRWAIDLWYELSRWHRNKHEIDLWLQAQDFKVLEKQLLKNSVLFSGVKQNRIYGMNLKWANCLEPSQWLAFLVKENRHDLAELCAVGLWRSA